MAEGQRGWHIGRIAPPRFLLFIAVFAVGLAVGIPALGWAQGTMAAFDAAAVVFLLAAVSLFRQGSAEEMRAAAEANGTNRGLLLVLTTAITVTVLAAVGSAVAEAHDPVATALVVATLVLSWTVSNLIYALHYAYLFYMEKKGDDGEDGDCRGLDFRNCDEPDYWDFLYFSNTLGMAFATSDTKLTSRGMRRVALGQTYAAFIFNLGVIAFAVGAIGGGG